MSVRTCLIVLGVIVTCGLAWIGLVHLLMRMDSAQEWWNE